MPPIEERSWSIAILLALQARVTEIDYDTGMMHSILSLWVRTFLA